MDEDRMPGFATRAIHRATTPPVEQETPSVPIYQTSTFRFEDSEAYAETISFRRPGYTYTRGYGNPTLLAFENVMADLEGTQAAFSFASGMAAIHTVITALATTGDRVVASPELYGGAYSMFTKVLPRYGIDVTFVNPHDPDAVAGALPGAALFYVETIANPNVTVADLEALGAICRAAGVPAVVDNTFASPALCTPARFGFDFVLHSATKYIGGHHDLTAGVVCCSEEDMRRLRGVVIETGGTMAPLEAWLAIRGLATLELRMQRHSSSALVIAQALDRHAKVERVHYPGLPSHPQHEVALRELPRGFGGMLAFEVEGGVEAGMRFCDALELAWVATSLGGTTTLVGHAASTTHRQLDPEARRAAGIGDGLVRVSVGLEDPEDLIEDFERALEKA
ncbi:MAG TPA: aminotransferase class I/II-fold pyridoxal phosphate-dependent enzyme [Actinomycetota bacterium]|nr:aminotransferase class I/II-fold pyridoxal phosphate-dependent enzyme [Actinomycetota bacterium]